MFKEVFVMTCDNIALLKKNTRKTKDESLGNSQWCLSLFMTEMIEKLRWNMD